MAQLIPEKDLRKLLDSRDACGRTPLLLASSQGQTKAVREILLLSSQEFGEKAARDLLGARETSGRNSLFLACKAGHLETAKLLLDNYKGCDWQTSDHGGKSPLYTASFYGHSKIVRLLLSQGADANQGHGNGITPLMAAAQQGHFKIVKRLIKRGAVMDQGHTAFCSIRS